MQTCEKMIRYFLTKKGAQEDYGLENEDVTDIVEDTTEELRNILLRDGIVERKEIQAKGD